MLWFFYSCSYGFINIMIPITTGMTLLLDQKFSIISFLFLLRKDFKWGFITLIWSYKMNIIDDISGIYNVELPVIKGERQICVSTFASIPRDILFSTIITDPCCKWSKSTHCPWIWSSGNFDEDMVGPIFMNEYDLEFILISLLIKKNEILVQSHWLFIWIHAFHKSLSNVLT